MTIAYLAWLPLRVTPDTPEVHLSVLAVEKLIIAKQASDLHTSHFTQAIIYQYLKDNDVDDHISKIRNAYVSRSRAMLSSIQKHFPFNVTYTKHEGGNVYLGRIAAGRSCA